MKVAEDRKKVREVKVLKVYNSAVTFNLVMFGILVVSLLIPPVFYSVSWLIIVICAYLNEKNKIKQLKYEYGFEPNEPVRIKRVNTRGMWISASIWILAVLGFLILYTR